jgi:hypothetical protein
VHTQMDYSSYMEGILSHTEMELRKQIAFA